jgi:hypothetical protein
MIDPHQRGGMLARLWIVSDFRRFGQVFGRIGAAGDVAGEQRPQGLVQGREQAVEQGVMAPAGVRFGGHGDSLYM